MQGKLLLFRPYLSSPDIAAFDVEPNIATMRLLLGGYFEPVPGFLTIEHDGVIHPCVALCRADSKRHGLPLNRAATVLWDSALRRHMGFGLIRPDGSRADHLLGNVAVLFED